MLVLLVVMVVVVSLSFCHLVGSVLYAKTPSLCQLLFIAVTSAFVFALDSLFGFWILFTLTSSETCQLLTITVVCHIHQQSHFPLSFIDFVFRPYPAYNSHMYI